jgi:hypothetical protein
MDSLLLGTAMTQINRLFDRLDRSALVVSDAIASGIVFLLVCLLAMLFAG